MTNVAIESRSCRWMKVHSALSVFFDRARVREETSTERAVSSSGAATVLTDAQTVKRKAEETVETDAQAKKRQTAVTHVPQVHVG